LVELSDGFLFLDSLDSIELGLTLGTSLESTDGSSKFSVFVEVGSEGSGQVVQFGFIFLSNIGQSDTGGVLLVNQSSQISSSSNETIWDVHFPAKGWKPDY
jgi:hypothetical protein